MFLVLFCLFHLMDVLFLQVAQGSHLDLVKKVLRERFGLLSLMLVSCVTLSQFLRPRECLEPAGAH